MRKFGKQIQGIIIGCGWVIMALSVAVATDGSWRNAGIPVMLGIGTIMYGLGAARAGWQGHRASNMVQTALALLMMILFLVALYKIIWNRF